MLGLVCIAREFFLFLWRVHVISTGRSALSRERDSGVLQPHRMVRGE
ncbi:unnamed protein product [Staurois parvus]|uniref:Uncharacterized protein n=1 Tax=Staurois parvus TaxID=386267 RepID=A0ABN9C6I8_9NEOB|nr:unnamed protein product [Staurois parvus]